jgi:hypothetical protein
MEYWGEEGKESVKGEGLSGGIASIFIMLSHGVPYSIPGHYYTIKATVP